jgi:catechol 2,3-dioxygenase-like lactoylglutathione lyase family enzyme
MPHHESTDFDATRAFYTQVLGLEERDFGGGYIGFGSGQAQGLVAPPGESPGRPRFFVRDPHRVVISVLAHN